MMCRSTELIQCCAQGLLCNGETHHCIRPSDSAFIQFSFPMRVFAYTHTWVCLEQTCPLLGHYLHSVACCNNGLKGVIEEKRSGWECGTHMAKYQEFFSCTWMRCAHSYLDRLVMDIIPENMAVFDLITLILTTQHVFRVVTIQVFHSVFLATKSEE